MHHINMKKDNTYKMNQKLEKVIQTGNLSKVKAILIENECNINNKDEYGRTVIYEAIVKGYSDIIEELCLAKIDINNRDNNGKTPLHFASIYYRFDIAKTLIRYGANVNIRDVNGNTPIFDAIFNSKGNPSIILLLKENNADYITPNNYGVCPKDLSETIANFDVSTILD